MSRQDSDGRDPQATRMGVAAMATATRTVLERAGETKDIDARSCTAQFLQGAQCHIFMPFGGWAGGTPKYTDDKILTYTNAQLDVKAAITWNLGVSGAGVITKSHVDILKRIRSKIHVRP